MAKLWTYFNNKNMLLGIVLLVVNGQNWKHYLAIWSHCLEFDYILPLKPKSENTHLYLGKNIVCVAWLKFDWIGVYQMRNYVVQIACSKATESKPVKLDTSCMVTLSLWWAFSETETCHQTFTEKKVRQHSVAIHFAKIG